jgi:hypothetical protein
MKDVIRVWKERNKILEGIKNRVFKKADVEYIAAERMAICDTCPFIDPEGHRCMVPGTGPCCGLCGCSLPLKIRALSATCDADRWGAVLSQEEQEAMDQHLAQDDNPTSDEITDIQS